MNVGDSIESAAWLTGEETHEQRIAYKDRVREAVGELCREKGFRHGEVTFTTLRPGEARVPAVPDHIQGRDVHLLVGEAVIVGPRIERAPFLGELDRKDLVRLRRITRVAHRKSRPNESLSDIACDEIIEALGPEAALDALRKAVTGETLH